MITPSRFASTTEHPYNRLAWIAQTVATSSSTARLASDSEEVVPDSALFLSPPVGASRLVTSVLTARIASTFHLRSTARSSKLLTLSCGFRLSQRPGPAPAASLPSAACCAHGRRAKMNGSAVVIAREPANFRVYNPLYIEEGDRTCLTSPEGGCRGLRWVGLRSLPLLD